MKSVVPTRPGPSASGSGTGPGQAREPDVHVGLHLLHEGARWGAAGHCVMPARRPGHEAAGAVLPVHVAGLSHMLSGEWCYRRLKQTWGRHNLEWLGYTKRKVSLMLREMHGVPMQPAGRPRS
mmetsp:Transcript_11750/g.25199  ORF Transcript_11750/g.25199 Transcript_11750/m.25199 type:complete len:123 (-) Transcript_11750:352-720(-)